LGFSAERQREFDSRWPVMRQLAERGWSVFVSLAPLIGPVVLPDDFLALSKWVIVIGEEGADERIRIMDAHWARAIREQCIDADIPLFLRGMGGRRTIPPDLRIRQFPQLG
jgi:protein gp37